MPHRRPRARSGASYVASGYVWGVVEEVCMIKGEGARTHTYTHTYREVPEDWRRARLRMGPGRGGLDEIYVDD
eukprot:39404-Eustigmatos_ZCMA.PRE.1